MGYNIGGIVVEKFIKSLLEADFDMAKSIILKFPVEKQSELIIKAAYDTENIIVYTFVCYLLNIESNIFYHKIAVEILIHVFQYIDGAYNAALYHQKCLCAFDPNNVEYMEMLLFFGDIPERLINNKDMLSIAYKILKIDPSNKLALDKISKLI